MDARADVSLLLDHRKGHALGHRPREKELLVHTEVILEEMQESQEKRERGRGMRKGIAYEQ